MRVVERVPEFCRRGFPSTRLRLVLSYLRLVEFKGATRPAIRINYLSLRDGMFLYHSLAPLNSVLNAVAATLLLAGYYCIRRKWVRAHRAFMLSAFAVSVTFFISYVIYHYHVGDVRFQGQGWVRPVYFTILISHILLATAIVPLVLVTLWRALNGHFRRHRQIARWAWPIWIYVSVTGVVVYLMCYQLYPPNYSKSVGAAVSATVENMQGAWLPLRVARKAP